MDEKDLKVCPFCGGKAYFRNPIANGVFDTMIIECRNCGASPYAINVYRYEDTEKKEKAIARLWNRREEDEL